MNRMLRSLLCLTLGLLAGTARATDYYMTPAGGASPQNGTSWAHAFPVSARTTVLNTTMQPGDTLYLGAGNYGAIGFGITTSGTSTARKQIIGVISGSDYPLFQRTGTRANSAITLGANSGYWTIKNIRIEGYSVGIDIKEASHPGVILDNILAYTITTGFKINDADGILVQNCRADRYAERGFYFLTDNNGVTVKNCVADMTGTGDTPDTAWKQGGNGPVGFDFHSSGSTQPPNTDVLLEDCVALNNEEINNDPYPQGDGIKCEQSNVGFTMRRCIMRGNRDGGCDLKGSNLLLEDCASLNNLRYGFKIWYQGTLNNCIAANNSARQFTFAANSSGYTITANYCTFYNATGSQDGVILENSTNTFYLNDSIIAYEGAKGSDGAYNTSTVVLTNTERLQNAGVTTNLPQFINPTTPWNGIGNNFDNQSYGLTKGYNSQATAIGDVISANLADPSGSNLLAAADLVGAVEVANWNNTSSANQTLANAADDSGAATTADIAFSNTTYGYVNDTPALAAPMADDAKMMRSQRATSSGSTMTATVTQVPYATYDVYVYWGGRTSLEPAPATMTVEFQLDSGGTYITSETKYMKDDNHLWDGSYNESAATSAAAAADGNEYVVFRNVTAAQFRIKSTCGARTGISGFQIVERP